MVYGQMRLSEWNRSSGEIIDQIEHLIEWGITTFDHADIYGDYSCEKLFGDALRLKRSLRDQIEIITKCGIKIRSKKYPSRKIKTYDYSYDHISSTVDQSLKNLNTDHIDLLLFHRPAPYFNPAEVSRTMEYLHSSGKVLHFGVSNFNPMQFDMLQEHTSFKLITNQVELSPYQLGSFDNGNIDYFLKEKIYPMAWSPLAGGKIFKMIDERGIRLFDELKIIAGEIDAPSLDTVIYSWLLSHPAKIIPVIGTGRYDRIKNAIDAFEYKLDMEQWYRIFIASRGKELD